MTIEQRLDALELSEARRGVRHGLVIAKKTAMAHPTTGLPLPYRSLLFVDNGKANRLAFGISAALIIRHHLAIFGNDGFT
jgi:hypothetical protein